MLLINLTAFSGHISTVAREAKRIADAFPEHHFSLTFNDHTVTVSGNDNIEGEYRAAVPCE
jgi:hypothetical protein